MDEWETRSIHARPLAMSVIPPGEVEFIERAAKYLENPSFMVRMADLIGMPVEGVLKIAPQPIADAVEVALRRTLDFAVATLAKPAPQGVTFPALVNGVWWTGYRHSALTACTGGVGGLFGTLGLCVELPITTCLMLRSMCAIAGKYGEDARQVDVRLECLSLFAAGGPSLDDDEMDSSYLAMRASLNSLVKHASSFVAHTPRQEVVTSIKNGTAPTLVKLLAKISKRFELAVSEKLMAQTIPFIGALGGASLNVLFAEHFNAVARYHFGLRHLERRWGDAAVRAIYHEAAASYPDANGRRRLKPHHAHFDYRDDQLLAIEVPKPR
jgi:hypothetical protein